MKTSYDEVFERFNQVMEEVAAVPAAEEAYIEALLTMQTNIQQRIEASEANMTVARVVAQSEAAEREREGK